MLARRHRAQDGFTLIELLVVVVIIGVLVAIAVPIYRSYEGVAQEDAAKADLRQVLAAVAKYEGDHQSLPSTRAVQTQDFTFDDGSQVKVSGDITLTYYKVSDQEYRVCTSAQKGLGHHFYYTNVDGQPIRSVAWLTDSLDCS